MADVHSSILLKTDPFLLDATVDNLENIAPNSSHSSPVLLGATSGGNSDEDRPFLHTSFNQLDGKKNKYRNPWKASESKAETEIVELEQTANEVWDAYRESYYGRDAVGSVFVRRKGSDTSKAKKGGVLEALFGIQKKCFSAENESQEIARWDSIHTVTIEVPNYEDGTCEYKIKTTVWCRYTPEDVGDVPKVEKPKKAPPTQRPKKKGPPKKNSSIKLDVTRLEKFGRATDKWDKGGLNQKNEPIPEERRKFLPQPPVPAVVTSSAVYTKDTTKVCKLPSLGGKNKSKPSKAIPVGSHIHNIGTLIEKIEANIRSTLERVDTPKCVEVLQGMYRPSLSPGLKLPGRRNSEGSGLIAKLGGHATGMGVGKSLIGEIALKAKSKGLGESSGSTNKAMENILSNEKKKLKDNEEANSSKPDRWSKAGLKKSMISPSKPVTPPGAAGFVGRPNLRKATSVRTLESSPAPSPAPEFMNFRKRLSSSKKSTSPNSMTTSQSERPSVTGTLKRPSLRKAASTRGILESPPASPTPEFMNFRNKLKRTAAK